VRAQARACGYKNSPLIATRHQPVSNGRPCGRLITNFPLKDEKMKQMITVLLGLVLVLSVAGVSLAAQGQAQIVCPVLGGQINKEIYADCPAARVYFCCPGCVGVFKNNPEKYLKKMEEQGVTPEKSPGGK
jgi:hypothetical protein